MPIPVWDRLGSESHPAHVMYSYTFWLYACDNAIAGIVTSRNNLVRHARGPLGRGSVHLEPGLRYLCVAPRAIDTSVQ